MLKVSDAFNSAFAAPDRELRARVTIGKTVYDSDDLTSINYDSGAMTGEQFSIGSTYMNSTKITFSHLVEGLKQLDEVLLEFGIVKADGTTEYVKMGTFIIDDKIQMDRNNNSTTIECMDRMVMLGGAYKSKLSYPATIKSVAVEIANMAGVRVNDTSFARLPNQSINEPIGYSYRDAIGIIAQFAMGFALFDRDGYLDIRTLVDSEFKIDPSQYFLKGLVKNETFFKLNGISCTVVTTSKDENGNETSKTTVLQSGSSSGSQIKLANNVMTQDVLDRMYESLKFTNYYPFTLNWNGNPAVEAGDWLTLEDMQGNEFKVPNMSFTLTFNGGLTASSKAETSTNSSVTYSYGGSMSNIVNEIGGRESAEGNHIYEGTEDQEPTLSKEGDLWYKHVGPDTEEWIYKDGKWEFLTSTKTANDAADAADKASKEAEEAKTQANKAVDGANDAVAKAGFANDTADQAKSDAAAAGQQAKDALTSAGTAITDAKKALTDSNSAMVDSAQARKDSATAIKDAADSLTSAKDALNKVGSLTTSVTSQFTTVNNELKSKVNQTDYDKLKGTVTSQQTEINQNASGIKLKADKSYADTINNSVVKNTSGIGLLNNQIALTVSKTELNNTLSSYATQTWTQSQIKSTADSINLNVSEVQSNLDNLSIGARNYLADTSTQWQMQGSGGANQASEGKWLFTFGSIKQAPFKDGEYVTVSFDYTNVGTGAYGTISPQFSNAPWAQFGVADAMKDNGHVVRTVQWKSDWTTSGTAKGIQIRMDNVATTRTVTVYNMQFERGNKATDWSEAPEDNASAVEFSNLEVKVNGIQGTVQNKADQSQVTQLANQISLKADTAALNTVKGTVDKQGSEITLNTNSIKLKADQSSVNTLKGTVDKQGSAIDVNTKAIALKANQSTVDALTGRVSTAEGKIIVQAGQIAQTVSKTDLTNTLKPYATQTWTQSQIKSTADAINLNVSKVQTDLSGTNTQFAELAVKVDGIQTTVSGKADKSQVTQLAGQITSVVGSLNSPNLIPNSGMPTNTSFWSSNIPEMFTVMGSLGGYTKGKMFSLMNVQGTDKVSACTSLIPVSRNTKYTFSFLILGSDNVFGYDVWFLGRPFGETKPFTTQHQLINNLKPKPNYEVDYKTVTFTTGDDDEGYIRVDNNGSTASGQSVIFFTEVKLERGEKATPWDQTAEGTELIQTRNDINLRVEKGKVINQINISPEGILIDGKKVHITGLTRIDNAVIEDAMIADIKADKITAGTLNAANVNVINLNANNITTGTIKGANLSLNLNTGEVLFQKGSIKSTNGNLNIRIDDGSMSLTNSLGNGAYFKDGNIYMTDSDFWTPGNPKIQYGTLKMVPNFMSDAGGGVALKGPNGVVVGTDEYSDTGIFGDLLSSPSGGGITLTKEHIRMASEGDIGIAGGKMYNSGFVGELPAIQVGIAGSHTEPRAWLPSNKTGDALFLSGEVVGVVADGGTGDFLSKNTSDLSVAGDARSGYVLSTAAYKRTYGSGDTVTITPNGVFGRISSASKYKLAIGEISTLNDEAHQFLSVKPKQWFDKSESEALADSMTTGNTDYVDDAKALPHNGFIAEDLYTAGLDSYVIRGNDGSIESIQYDRLPVLHHELIRELFNRLDAAEMEIYKLKQEANNAS